MDAMKAKDLRSLDPRLVCVLLVAAVCLPLQDTLGRHDLLDSIPLLRGRSLEVAYGLVPFACLILLGTNPLRYFRLGDWKLATPIVLVFVAILVASTAFLASFDSWSRFYGTGCALHFSHLANILLAITCGEFFFRGFLLFPLFERFGWYALPIAVLPYGVIHLGKPAIEIYGSLVFGLGLAYLALRSRSILYGIALHWLLNVLIPITIAARS